MGSTLLRSTLLASALLFTGCTEADVCALVGDYTGTFTGDYEGTVTLAIEDNDGEVLVSVDLENDALSALGEGTLSCEDGAFTTTLTTDAGEALGTLEGIIDEEGAGSGTWEFTDGDLAGATGEWTAG